MFISILLKSIISFVIIFSFDFILLDFKMDFDTFSDPIWYYYTILGLIEILSKTQKWNDHNVTKEEIVHIIDNEIIGFNNSLHNF